MKKSSYILLTLVGAAALSAHFGRQPDVVRDVYNSREDCVHDYSDTQCRQTPGAGHGGTVGRWYGPDYRHDSNRSLSGTRAAGRESVQRGGFGFSGRRSGGS